MAKQYAKFSVRGVGGGRMSTKLPHGPTARVLTRYASNARRKA